VAEHEKGVLFLCTGNSARSLLAECLLQRLGHGRFRAYSAGSQPKAAPHLQTLALLRELGYATAQLRSKSWDEFVGPGSPAIDLVVTVCDAAAGEACPLFPGNPARLHWSIDDPASIRGSEAEVRAEFLRAYDALEWRIGALVKGCA
jgi:protein-tyrosine-phosphatase